MSLYGVRLEKVDSNLDLTTNMEAISKAFLMYWRRFEGSQTISKHDMQKSAYVFQFWDSGASLISSILSDILLTCGDASGLL